MKSLSIALTILLTTVASFTYGQNGTIKGHIKDGESVLPSATVSIGNRNIIANSAGAFSISLAAGSYVLIVTHAGYKKFEQEITLAANETRMLLIKLDRQEQLGEVVVLGSRSDVQRSNLTTPVPVDAFSSRKLIQTGQSSLTQMLTFVAPSLTASRQLLNEPVTLRGLDPDHVLILMNGIRYHQMAWLNAGNLKGQLGRGSVGNDLNSIPFSAIEKIEILRDGASAQFGSDAIAAVMDIRLKEGTGKTSIRLHLGQFYKGDGEKFSIGLNRGFSINKRGFLNFSADYRYQAPTFRGGEYLGMVYYDTTRKTSQQKDSLLVLDNQKILDRHFNRKAAVSNDGITQVNTFGFVVNGSYTINKNIELFCTALFNHRLTVYPGAYRFPKDSLRQVNTALYPDGFKVSIQIATYDVSTIAGVKGQLLKNWHWKFSSAYGNNTVSNNATNTNNASQSALGKNAQTAFYCGKQIFNQLTNNLEFAKNFASRTGKIKLCNLDLGAEWRLEDYRQKAGEEASWRNYDTQGKRDGGAQGAPVVDTAFAKNESRSIVAAYIDFETELNNRFLVDLAMRYENYSDFGGNLSGKIAGRYKFSEKFYLRGSISNGFRAPSLQQLYYGVISNGWIPSGSTLVPSIKGIFPNDHAIPKAFDVAPLAPEKSINLGFGFTATVLNHFSVTADVYWIQLKNRIVLSGIFNKMNPDVKKILDSIPGVSADQVQFFTNAINTKTAGADIVFDGKWNVGKASLDANLSANFTGTYLFGAVKTTDKLPAERNANTLFNIEERTKIEKGQPNEKIIFSIICNKPRTGFIVRNTLFGKTSTATIYNNPDRVLYEHFSSKILTDISFDYLPKQWVTLTVGADNIFDVYPDRLKNPDNTALGTLIYSNDASPFGFNGGYYFVSMGFNF